MGALPKEPLERPLLDNPTFGAGARMNLVAPLRSLAPFHSRMDVDVDLILRSEDCSMSDAVSRLNAGLEGRYGMRRELGEGVPKELFAP